jgi:uncharacterized protein affecting Mg2+/Co2+ transport
MPSTIMNVTEVSVIKAAREWATKNGQDGTQTIIEAEGAIGESDPSLLGRPIRKR